MMQYIMCICILNTKASLALNYDDKFKMYKLFKI